MSPRRSRSNGPPSADAVLTSIQQTGCELIRQCGKAHAMIPNGGHVPRGVLLDVIAHVSGLHKTLFEYVAQFEQQHQQPRDGAVDGKPS